MENVADLYGLKRDDFVRIEDGRVVNLPLFGAKTRRGEDGALEIVEAKRADKVVSAIEESRQRPFARVLFALGIRHVGSVTAQALVERYPSMDALQTASAGEGSPTSPASARWSPRRWSSSSATSTTARRWRSSASQACAWSNRTARPARPGR